MKSLCDKDEQSAGMKKIIKKIIDHGVIAMTLQDLIDKISNIPIITGPA